LATASTSSSSLRVPQLLVVSDAPCACPANEKGTAPPGEADQDELTLSADQAGAESHRGVDAHEVEDGSSTGVSDVPSDLFIGIGTPRIDDGVGTEFERQVAFARVGVHHHDRCLRQQVEELNSILAETAGADEHGAAARNQERKHLLDGRIRRLRRIRQRRGQHWIEVTDGKQFPDGRHEQILGVASGRTHAASEIGVAQLLLAAEAEPAVTGAPSTEDRDRVSDLKALAFGAGTERFDPAGVLVT
jgi:hypothetical protein